MHSTAPSRPRRSPTDIVYISDLSGFLYALDANTGEHYWTYDAFAAVWGSAYVADGKVYMGDEDGDLAVLKAGKGKDGQPEVLAEINMGSAVYTTPVARDGVLYVMSRNTPLRSRAGRQGEGRALEALPVRGNSNPRTSNPWR